jgi:DMSO/TMAO reductase YedYZ molybdopterin-dependent catalytic subunit
LAHRIPPGQIATRRWPVLHQGVVPGFDPATWDFHVWGLVESPAVWTWETFRALPIVRVEGDLHCVRRWSSLDHVWEGVSAQTLCDWVGVQPAARFAILHGEGGYTANLPLDVFRGDDVVLATHHAGQPLAAEHGAPVRAVAPGCYGWKSVKWLRGIAFVAADEPGFWEGYGYSHSADVWREERFAP